MTLRELIYSTCIGCDMTRVGTYNTRLFSTEEVFLSFRINFGYTGQATVTADLLICSVNYTECDNAKKETAYEKTGCDTYT
jgi:hypothetical protein